MNTNRDLNYRLYVQKESGFTRTPFQTEFEKYMTIRSGDVEAVKRNFAAIRNNFWAGKGELSDDPIKNIRYHFIISVALISRVCVEGGMNHDTAYTLSDIYIRRADKCTSCEKMIDMLGEMQVDFAERMRELKKEKVISIHVRKVIDYIYEHLHEKLTVQALADFVKLNPAYLSKLFMQETGIALKDFIKKARVGTAENMLKYSEFSYSDIALSLGFSSQSAFISVFKEVNGMTPKVYRETYYMNNITKD